MATDAPARRRAAFHDLTVAQVRPLTDDAIEVTFEVPEDLADAFEYSPGQYIAIRAEVADEDLRRSYSICQAPTPGFLKVAIKRELGGRFSTWAIENLEAGMALSVMSPDGNFVPATPTDQAARFVGVAAGSGITPMMALVDHILRSNPGNTFDLVYSNRTVLDAMFIDELAELKDRFPTRLALHHVLTRERRSAELLSGRLDADRLKIILGTLVDARSADEWFLCGPFELVQTCRDTLAELGVDAKAVHFELFTTGRPDRPLGQIGAPLVSDEVGTEVHTVTFRLDGTTTTVTTPKHSRESILNAALRVRPDVPFACAGGVCGTCRAKLVDGQVDMVENYALEPDELANGYVLSCQAVPVTDAVFVDYDG